MSYRILRLITACAAIPFCATLAGGKAHAAGGLSLEEALDEAERNSVAVRAQEATLASKDASADKSFSAMGPRVSLEAQQIWLSDDVNKLVGTSAGGQTIPDEIRKVSLQVAQPLVALGPIYFKGQADLIDKDLAAAQLVTEKLKTRHRAAKAWFGVQRAEEFLQVANQGLAVAKRNFLDTQAQARQGMVDNSDVLRLNVEVLTAEVEVTSANAARQLAYRGLAEVLGRPDPSGVKVAKFENLWIPQEDAIPSFEIALALAVKYRSDITSALKRIEALDLLRKAAFVDYLPQVNAFARFERDLLAEDKAISAPTGRVLPDNSVIITGSRDTGSSVSKGDFRDNLSFGFNVSWTLWDWGARSATNRELAAYTAQSEAGLAGALSGVRMEIDGGTLKVREKMASLRSMQAAGKMTDEIGRLVRLRHENGQVGTTDLISLQRDERRVRAGLVNARIELVLAWLALQEAMGLPPALTPIPST